MQQNHLTLFYLYVLVKNGYTCAYVFTNHNLIPFINCMEEHNANPTPPAGTTTVEKTEEQIINNPAKELRDELAKAPDFADELIELYEDHVKNLTVCIEARQNDINPETQIIVADWKIDRATTEENILDRKFRKLQINDRGAWFQAKIDLADLIIIAYKFKEAALQLLSSGTVSSPEELLLKSRYKIDLFHTKGAIITQEFNKVELLEKREGYKARMDMYKERVDKEWNSTLLAAKNKLHKLSKQRPVTKELQNNMDGLRNSLDRAEQPFNSIEEKIEFYISVESQVV